MVALQPLDEGTHAVHTDGGIGLLFIIALAVDARTIAVEIAVGLEDEVVCRIAQRLQSLVDVRPTFCRAPCVASHYDGRLAVNAADRVDSHLGNIYPRTTLEHVVWFVAKPIAVESRLVLQGTCYCCPALSEMGRLQGIANNSVLTLIVAAPVVMHIEQYLHAATVSLAKQETDIFQFIGTERTVYFTLQALPFEGQADEHHAF